MKKLAIDTSVFMMRGLIGCILLFCIVPRCLAQFNSKQFPVPAYQTYQERYNAIEKLWRSSPLSLGGFVSTEAEHAGIKLYYDPTNQKIKDSLYTIMAKRPMMSNFGFNNFSAVAGYYVGKKAFTSAVDQKKWRDYLYLANYTKGYIGSNAGKYMHWIATYLICQEWANFVDSAGNTAAQLMPIAKTNIESLLYASFHVGDEDRGDLIYSDIVIASVKLLATYGNDLTLKRKAEDVYYAMLVNFAEGWNNGNYTSPATREKHFNDYGPFEPTGIHLTAWVLFGDTYGLKAMPSWKSWLFTFPSYLNDNIPAPIINLGQQRSAPFAIYGFQFEWGRKYIWHSPSYSLVSQWVGAWTTNAWIDFSITEQLLKWQSNFAGANLHISYENYASTTLSGPKNVYGLGRNPYSRTWQYQATQMGVCNVPSSYAYRQQFAMFSNTGAIITRKDTSNWVFCNGGTNFFAVRFLKQCTWGKDPNTGYDLMLSDFSKNGWLLETTEESKYQKSGTTNAQKFAAFIKDVLGNTSVDASKINDSLPSIGYKSIHGYTMEMQYENRAFIHTQSELVPMVRKVNGQNVLPYSSYPTEGSTNNSVFQRRKGDTLVVTGRNQQTLIIWDQSVTVSSTCSAAISSSSNSICAGSSASLVANVGKTYKWFNGTTQVSTASTYNVTSAGSYTVEVTNANGCKATSGIKTISVNPVPTINITSPANNATLTTNTFPINVMVTGTNISNVSFNNGTSLLGTDITSPYGITIPSLANGTYTFFAIAKNTFNCTDTAKVTLKVNKVVTDLDEEKINLNRQAAIYPNPFNQSFQIQFKGDFNYWLYDTNGQELEHGNAKDDIILGENLAQGLYIIKIEGENGRSNFKISKN